MYFSLSPIHTHTRECQQKDWSKHKMKCRISKSFPIAFPFVISLPASQVTYDGIAEQAEMFARSVVH